MSRIRTALIAAAAASAIVFATAPARADDTSLTWKGLDLSSAAGRAELARRVDVAAGQACSVNTVTGSRLSSRPSTACVAEKRSEIQAMLAKRLPRLASAPAALAAGGRADAEVR